MAEPIDKFRAGQISCALFENDVTINGRATTMVKATVARRYKDSNGEWKSSGSFSRNEIPLVIYCLQKAYAAIIERSQEVEEVVVE
ncbi:MAG: hypothetical protein D8M59_03715 [Planctomycetes bacterium]|nr:hypothetical protein [Planctomycetota bacterium]NOG53104.1 hypothetical protein [Planctomycetota bacterium]